MYNITRGNVAPLRATLTFDDEPFMVVNAEDVEVALQSCFKRYVLEDFAIDADAHRAYLNGTAFTLKNYTTFQCTQTLLLFALHDYNNVIIAFGSAKLYSLYIEENGQKVIDLIPIRIGQVGYMFDMVNGNLYGNAGTGDFVLGGDVD